MNAKLKELVAKLDMDLVSDKLQDLYEEIVTTSNTGYSQTLVLHDDGTLDIHRLGQNSSLQAEFNGEAVTLYSAQEFDFTDIEGWDDEDVTAYDYRVETLTDWLYTAIEHVEENIEIICNAL